MEEHRYYYYNIFLRAGASKVWVGCCVCRYTLDANRIDIFIWQT